MINIYKQSNKVDVNRYPIIDCRYYRVEYLNSPSIEQNSISIAQNCIQAPGAYSGKDGIWKVSYNNSGLLLFLGFDKKWKLAAMSDTPIENMPFN